MDQKHKLEKPKELTDMQVTADTHSDAYEEDSSVEDNKTEAEPQEEQESSVGQQLN
jgi:hypothetical protein